MTPPVLNDTTNVAADSIAVQDSLPVRGDLLIEGIVIDPPPKVSPLLRDIPPAGGSWVLSVLLLFFCVVAFRVRNNGRYLSSLIYDLTQVRERHNVFDDTVRETSLLILLNILWCLSAGVTLRAMVLALGTPIGPGTQDPTLTTALCTGLTIVYALLMSAAYYVIGDVFTDRHQAGMWLRGFLASQALMSFMLLPISLLLVTMPAWTEGLLIAAAVALVLSKLLFIWKGFRIFFTRISSWVLFLYYLCSLEIIPLILIYVAATEICASVT